MEAMPSKNLAVSTVPLLMPYIQRRPETVGGKPFKLVSDYTPAGDQPEAIRQLLEGVADSERDQVLLGVTGSGKTVTMANVIATTGTPALVLGWDDVPAPGVRFHAVKNDREAREIAEEADAAGRHLTCFAREETAQ